MKPDRSVRAARKVGGRAGQAERAGTEERRESAVRTVVGALVAQVLQLGLQLAREREDSGAAVRLEGGCEHRTPHTAQCVRGPLSQET